MAEKRGAKDWHLHQWESKGRESKGRDMGKGKQSCHIGEESEGEKVAAAQDDNDIECRALLHPTLLFPKLDAKNCIHL